MLCELFIVFSAVASHGNTPTVSGPLSGMFSASSLLAMSAEEEQDLLTQQQLNSERAATEAAAAAETAAADVAEASKATATVETASVDASLSSGVPPAQHKQVPSGRSKQLLSTRIICTPCLRVAFPLKPQQKTATRTCA